MISRDTKDLIDSVVDEFMQARKVFTSLHVTNEVKRRGAASQPPRGYGHHRDMAEHVRLAAAMYETLYDYDRELSAIGPFEAIVYFPRGTQQDAITRVLREPIVTIPPVEVLTQTTEPARSEQQSFFARLAAHVRALLKEPPPQDWN
jgi:hypothetical protein